MPKVSVIIPNYNHARFLEKRVKSILEQTYQNFEIIYLDDCSTDESNQVFAQFLPDKRIQTIYNTVNSGTPFKQWEKGLQIAQGDYVWIAESDDFSSINFLENLVPILDQNLSIGLVYSQSSGIDENDQVIRTWKTWTDDLDRDRWAQDFINQGIDECQRYLIVKNTIPNASAVLMRRSVLNKTGKLDTKLRLAGDWLLWAKMLSISDIAFVAKPLNNFRTHTRTVRNTVNPSLELEERLRVIQYLSQRIELPNYFWKNVFEPSVGWWIRMSLMGKIEIKKIWMIYILLGSIDPNLNYRIVKKMFDALKLKFSII